MIQKMNVFCVIVFFIVLIGIPAGSLIRPRQEILKSERRKAAVFPEITAAGILNREVMDGVEDYMRDHVIFRETFRRWKADTAVDVLRMKEINGLYKSEDGIYRPEYPLNEAKAARAAEKFSAVAGDYFPNANVYYSVIPDKNYFAARENGYPAMDYEKLDSILDKNMTDMSYIELKNLLTLEDYYRTDLHWRQEQIVDVADFLLESMGKNMAAKTQYTEYARYESYFGSYASQSGWKVKPDTIVCLTSPEIGSAVVTDYEKKSEMPVYSPQFFADDTQSVDAYDVYLSGAKAILSIENMCRPDGDTLVLFRDSFGSSIAPLLLKGYSEVIMIDLRYVAMEYVDKVVDLPERCDVLFLYNTQVLNHGDSLR